MRLRYSVGLLILSLALSLPALGQGAAKGGGDSSGGAMAKVPSGVILVKGAWSSASDSVTPLPEGGAVAHGVFRDPYFAMTYAVPMDWTEKYKGPPPSHTGRYVLAELSPADTFKGPARGSLMIGAEDMFFTVTPARNAVELIDYMSHHLQGDYKVEAPPKQLKIADRSFTFFSYWSPAAELHWYLLATEIRCHAVQIVLTSRDTKLLDNLVLDLNKMKLPAEASPTGGTGGGAVPVCIKDYARDENMLARVDPVLTDHKFNSVPVRIVIGKNGKVKHIHFLSAFPDQTKAISDALARWQFKPYKKDGQPLEVETGIRFGRGSAQDASK